VTELLGVLSEEWAVRALIASSLVGIMCGVVGSFMVLRNMSLIGDALSHAILPGIFVAFVVLGYSSTGFFIGTLVAALFSAVLMTWLQEKINTKNDAIMGIIFTVMFSLGVIGISYLNNQQGVHLDLQDFLFGTVLGVNNSDIVITAIITVFIILSIILFYRYLFITTFQPVIAETMGISVKTMHYFLMLLLSFAIVSALRTVGIILVVAMLITPSATALLLTDKLKKVIVLSGLIGLFSAVTGLLLAIIYDTTPGPAMCVVVTICYFAAVFFSPTKGLLPRRFRKWRLSNQIQREDIIKYLTKQKSLHHNDLAAAGTRLDISSTRMKSHLKSLIKSAHISKSSDTYTLTPSGETWGQDLIRAHRLWETFLVDKMGLKGDEIHEDAEKYEHLLDMEFLDQLDAKLGYPTTDPHGSPIPVKQSLSKAVMTRLEVGGRGRISHEQHDSQIESKLWELSLTPGSVVYLQEKDDEKLIIKHGEDLLDIPASLAQVIRIDRISSN